MFVTTKLNSFVKKEYLLAILGLISIVSLAAGGYFYDQYHKSQLILGTQKTASDPQPDLQAITQALSGTGSATLASTQTRVVLRNGTTIVGLATKSEPEIKNILPNVTVVAKDNAQKNNYLKTLVVIINPDFKDNATNLANQLNADLSPLPDGEIKPQNADILIIIGKDHS